MWVGLSEIEVMMCWFDLYRVQVWARQVLFLIGFAGLSDQAVVLTSEYCSGWW